MVFNGIDAVKNLASDVGAKSFVIHEKGVKTRALRQRSVGSTTKVKTELGKFADTPEYQNGQYFIMFLMILSMKKSINFEIPQKYVFGT